MAGNHFYSSYPRWLATLSIASVFLVCIWLLYSLLNILLPVHLSDSSLAVDGDHSTTQLILYASTLFAIVGFSLFYLSNRVKQSSVREARLWQQLSGINAAEDECIKTVSAQGHILNMNAAGVRLLDAESLDQVRDIKVSTVIVPKYHKAYEAFHNELLSGKPDRVIFELLTLKGKRRTMESSAVPLPNQNGKVESYIAVTRDVTESNRNKSYQNKLKTELQHAQMYIASTTDLILSLDRNYCYRFCNDAYLGANGLERESYIGLPLADVIGKDLFYSRVKSELDNCLAGEIVEYEMWSNFKLLGKRYLEVKYVPLRLDDGSIDGALVNIRDSTQQQNTEVATQQLTNRLKLALDSGNLGVWDWNIVDNELEWDDHMFAMHGLARTDFSNAYEAWLAVLHPEDAERAQQENLKSVHEGGDFNTVFRIVRPTGAIRHIQASGLVVRDDNGNPLRMIGVNTDITDKVLDQQNLSVLSSAVESSAAAVLIASVSGQVEYINSSFTQLTGYTEAEILGNEFDLLGLEKNNQIGYQKIQKSLDENGQWQGQLVIERKDGSSFWSKVALSSVKNKQGQVTHMVGIHEDISKEVVLTEKLKYDARHDALTGLFNRFEFERRFELLLTGTWRKNSEYTLCFLDLDQFKIINDNGGHAAGDELLRQIGQFFSAIVREGDVVARIGGDEFALLISDCSIADAQEVAQKILNGIRDLEFNWEGKKYWIGVSIGLVAIRSNQVSSSNLMIQADTACYLAKANGKNRIQVYHQNDPEAERRHGEIRWIERINDALDNDLFLLYAQAIEPFNGAEKTKYELLIRLRSRTGEIIAPGEFLPAAERYQMIQSIDKWVVQHAFDLINANPAFIDAGHSVSINLSGQSLADDKMLEFIIKHLQAGTFNAQCICFEITETAAISTLKGANDFITSLRRFGCKFALDDFGSGFSSFGYLKKLPVDYLKIDGMFVKNIHRDSIDLAMVKSINQIGKVMGMETIAEYVENDDVKNILSDIGVDYAQGYGIGKPAPFLDLLSHWSNDKNPHSEKIIAINSAV